MPTSHRTTFFSTLPPALALAATAVLLAGCSSITSTDTAGTMSSSSAKARTRVPAPSAVSSSSEPKAAAKVYKDGTYSATGNYLSPAGNDEIQVSLTLKNGVITAATYEGMAKMGKSKDFQAKFGAGYETAVVGKSIDSLSLGVINGSSLTPKGFMDAVAKIKAEAKA